MHLFITSLLQYGPSVGRYGFYGVRGFPGVILGIICMIVVFAVLWQIGELIVSKFGLDATWVRIIKLLLFLLIFLWFINVIFAVFG